MLDILDIQRDHKKLIDGAMSLLASDGILYFSNNLRSFVLDDSVSEQYAVKDISKQSVPTISAQKNPSMLGNQA